MAYLRLSYLLDGLNTLHDILSFEVIWVFMDVSWQFRLNHLLKMATNYEVPENSFVHAGEFVHVVNVGTGS